MFDHIIMCLDFGAFNDVHEDGIFLLFMLMFPKDFFFYLKIFQSKFSKFPENFSEVVTHEFGRSGKLFLVMNDSFVLREYWFIDMCQCPKNKDEFVFVGCW